MGELFDWITKNYTISLFPFLLSAMLTFFAYRELSWKIIDPGLLSFSMALLTVGLLMQFAVSHKKDSSLVTTVSAYYVGFIIAFLAIFCWVTVLKIQNERFIEQILSLLSGNSNTIQISQLDIIHNLISLDADTVSQLEFVRPAPVIFAFVLFIYSMAVNQRNPPDVN
jgi:hypothetical protein